MQILRRQAYARAGLVGNPSDGYHGKTISIIVRNYSARVVLYEWEDLELILSQEDHCRFKNVQELLHDVELHGYYGGIRLVKATVKKFVEYCNRRGLRLHDRNFSVRYETDIPRQVGLAGSSAIIVATLRALMDFYDVAIPKEVQPSLVLSVEQEELGITAGLQDRVIQVYEGLVYMDFSREAMRAIEGYQCGRYEPLDPALLPPLYLAFSTAASEPTEQTHAPLRTRYEHGDPEVLRAMQRFAELAEEARDAILSQDAQRLGRLIDENFDLRRRICDLAPSHVKMVETARHVGASAKFAGSGGAIIGTYRDEAMFERLKMELEAIGCQVIQPIIHCEVPAGAG
ncbi:MAG: GHMP kinase [Planctomycetes bacterium]|nr:GHMP kinase [Planctomycetota bacterium]